MTSALPQTLVVIGTGPGIGTTTASFFASQTQPQPRFQHVALISRNPERLGQDRARVLKDASAAGRPDVDVSIWSVDVTQTSEFKKVLASIAEKSRVSCVLFNAAKVALSELFVYGEEEVVHDFMTTNIALYTTAAWALPLLLTQQKKEKPSLFVTSSLLWAEPIPQLSSLSMVKASQRNLVQSLQKTYPQIHIAMLYVGGVVSEEDAVLNPRAIAARFWDLYDQEPEDWTGELTIGGPA